jgi:hypothetical protein
MHNELLLAVEIGKGKENSRGNWSRAPSSLFHVVGLLSRILPSTGRNPEG